MIWIYTTLSFSCEWSHTSNMLTYNRGLTWRSTDAWDSQISVKCNWTVPISFVVWHCRMGKNLLKAIKVIKTSRNPYETILRCSLRCVCFVCLFRGFRPTREFFTHFKTSPLPVKGCKFRRMLGTCGHRAVRVL